jgi:hypothetical protein
VQAVLALRTVLVKIHRRIVSRIRIIGPTRVQVWNLCLCTLSDRFANKLGSGNVEFLDFYQRGCSLNERSEEIA